MQGYFDNDNTAAQALNDEDRATAAILARFDDLMSYVGEAPTVASAHLLDWEA